MNVTEESVSKEKQDTQAQTKTRLEREKDSYSKESNII